MNAPFVIGFGAGVDSMAMLIGLRARGEYPDAIVFSDTRGEKPETYSYISEVLAPWLRDAAFPTLTVVCRADFPNTKTGDKSLEDECLRLGNLPARAYGYGTCADKWKIDPFKWWAKTWQPARDSWAAGGVVLRGIGYEFGEEHRISEATDKGFTKRYPLIEWRWDRDTCERKILAAGLPIPPKSACFFCPSSRKPEILALRASHPALAARAIALEDNAIAADKLGTVRGLGRRFAWRNLYEPQNRQQFELWPEAPVESCTVCHEGES